MAKSLTPARSESASDARKAPNNTRADQKAETRQALIREARALFAARGYHGVGVREFVASAGVTRGALYHHFPGGKEELFVAVFDEVERESITQARQLRDKMNPGDVWQSVRNSVQAYLDTVQDPNVQRITLLDGPVVLGWPRWRRLEERHGLGTLMQALEEAMRSGFIKEQPIVPLAHLVFGSVMEAALLVAHSPDPEQYRHDVGRALDMLLRGLETR